MGLYYLTVATLHDLKPLIREGMVTNPLRSNSPSQDSSKWLQLETVVGRKLTAADFCMSVLHKEGNMIKYELNKLSSTKDHSWSVNRKKAGIITCIIVLVSISVWYFAIRPSVAKAGCNRFASDVSRKGEVSDKPGLYYYDKSNYQFAYESCLHKRGF